MPRRSLYKQLLVSHLVLVGFMFVLLVGAVADFFRLSGKIDRILKDNYASVVVLQRMKESLARLDSSAALSLTGNRDFASKEFEVGSKVFDTNFDVEAHNITEPGEKELVEKIDREWKTYRAKMAGFINGQLLASSPESGPILLGELHPANLQLGADAQAVLDLNETAIIRADRAARAAARRSAWTGLGFTISAVLLAVYYVRKIVNAILSPVRKLARHAEEVGAGHLGSTVEVEHEDEIGVLAESFNKMTASLLEAHKREEERFHRAERMSAVALRNLYDPVIVTDSQGLVVHWNRAAEGLFGSIHDAKGKPVQEVISDKRISEAVDRAIHHEHTSAAEDEAGRVTFKAGNAERTYRLRATPMMDEEAGLIGSVTVLEDITHLREIDRLKTEFIGVASHELKTPVTSLLMSVQLLQEGAGADLTSEQAEIVNAQKEDLERLDRMMRDLLDLTRLEAGVVPPRLVVTSVSSIIENAVTAIKPAAYSKNIKLEVEIPSKLPDVPADKEQITRALVNLLNNACRHSPEGGLVQVSASWKDNRLEARVSDSGPGIPEAYLEKIFDRFVQVPGATRGGAGLGLSIARTIVRAHGGEITVSSVVGEGSTFILSLPLRQIQAMDPNIPSSRSYATEAPAVN